MTDSRPVWEATLDGRYRVSVARTDPYRGLLRIVDTETEEVIHQEEVGLSYGATFGPDVGDVARWQELALAVVDRRRTSAAQAEAADEDGDESAPYRVR